LAIAAKGAFGYRSFHRRGKSTEERDSSGKMEGGKGPPEKGRVAQSFGERWRSGSNERC